jgi:hypothetical protein
VTPLAERMTEAQFQAWIIESAGWRKWLVFHCRDSRGKRLVGLPDLILIRPPRVLFLEVKNMTRAATPEQRHVLDELGRCPGVEAHLVRPSDQQWLQDEVLP